MGFSSYHSFRSVKIKGNKMSVVLDEFKNLKKKIRKLQKEKRTLQSELDYLKSELPKEFKTCGACKSQNKNSKNGR